MIDLTEKPEEERKVLMDLTEKPLPGAPALDQDTLETRAAKYNLALGEGSPGLSKIQSLLQSPGGEESIREAAAGMEESDRRTAGNDIFASATDVSAETLQSVVEASRAPVNRSIALEKRFAERTFSATLAMTSNPEEVSAGAQEEISQEMYDYLVDTQTRTEGFRKIHEDRAARNRGSSWGKTLLDVGQSLIPFYSATTQVSPALGEKLKAILPGNNKEEQYAYLRSLPTAEAVELAKRVDEEIGNWNSLEAEEWSRGLVEGYTAGPQVMENLLFGMDVTGVVGPIAKKLGIKAAAGIAKGTAASKRVKEAEALTKNYTVRKELLNKVEAPPKSTPKEAPPSVDETFSINGEKLSTRKARADYERMLQEQSKREKLLASEEAMTAYAKDKGISLEEMRSLISSNYEEGKKYLAELDAVVNSDSFKAAEASAKEKASSIQFKDISTSPKEEALAVIERLRRTAGATSMPNAKIDEVLSASGYIEEAADLRALELARKMVNGTETGAEGIATLLQRTASLFNPKAFFYDTAHAHIGRAADLAETLMRNRELFATAFSKVLNVQVLPAAVERQALDAAAKELKEAANNSGLEKALLTAYEHGSDVDGLNMPYIEAKWGTKEGTLFESRQLADNVAKERYGFLEGTYQIMQEGDGYAIFTRKDIDQVEAIRNADIKLIPEMQSDITRNVFGLLPKSVTGIKESLSAKQIGERDTFLHAQNALENYMKAMVEPLNALSKKELKALSKIMDINRKMRNPDNPKLRGAFFKNASEFEMSYIQNIGRLPTAEETRAYAVFVQQSDMDYIFRSVNMVKAKARFGVEKMQTVIKRTDKDAILEYEGVRKDSLPTFDKDDAVVFDTTGSGRKFRLSERELTGKANAYIKDKNLHVVQVFDPDDTKLLKELGITGPLNFLIVKDLKRGALRFDEQLPYRPGFHVRYKDEIFVGQGKFTVDGTGRKLYQGETTILGVSNMAKAMREGKLLERARLAIVRKDEKELDQIIKDGLPMSKPEIVRLFKTRLSLSIPISVRRQGENIGMADVKTVNGKSMRDEIGEFTDLSNSPFNLSHQVKDQYTGEKNEALWSIAEEGTRGSPLYKMEDARMVDPIQTQMEAMNRLIRDRHYNDYQLASAEGFIKEFKDIMTPDGVNVWSEEEIMRNPVWYLQNAKLKGTPADARYATAKQQQLAIGNLLRHKSIVNSSLAHIKGKALESIYNRWGEKYVHAFDDFAGMLTADIPTKMRAFAFHTQLGLFSPVQIYLQSQTLGVISALSPKYGVQANEVSFGMFRLNLMPGDEAAIDKWAKATAKLTPGWSEKEFKESWALLRRTGYDIVRGEHSIRNDIRDVKMFKGKFASFIDSGGMFFNGIERWIRLTAWNTAYKEYVEKFPKLAGQLGPSDAKLIMSRANDLSMNMTRAGNAIWQEGAASTMTQFWGYSMRMFDALTGKRLTKGEKARLIGLNSLLYGVPIGVTPMLPIWPWEEEIRQMLMESGVNTNEGVVDLIMNGLVASAISGITSSYGEDIQLDLGGRLGPNAIQVLWNLNELRMDEDGIDALVGVLGGASGSIIARAISNTMPLVKDLAALTGEDDTTTPDIIIADGLLALNSIASLRGAEKAWLAYNLGTYKTRDGRILDGEYTMLEAITSGLTGVESQDVNDTFLRFRSIKEQKATEQKVRNEASRYIRHMIQERKDGNDKAADSFRNKARGLLIAGGFTQKQITEIFQKVRKEKSLEKSAVDQWVKQPNKQPERDLRLNQTRGQ